MALYFYKTTANSISLVGADGTAQVLTGPNLALDEISFDTAAEGFNGLAAHAPTFVDLPMSPIGWALPDVEIDPLFLDQKLPLEWEF